MELGLLHVPKDSDFTWSLWWIMQVPNFQKAFSIKCPVGLLTTIVWSSQATLWCNRGNSPIKVSNNATSCAYLPSGYSMTKIGQSFFSHHHLLDSTFLTWRSIIQVAQKYNHNQLIPEKQNIITKPEEYFKKALAKPGKVSVWMCQFDVITQNIFTFPSKTVQSVWKESFAWILQAPNHGFHPVCWP